MASIPVMDVRVIRFSFFGVGLIHLPHLMIIHAFFTYVIKAFFIQKKQYKNTIGIFECN
jgi:hypothetical protein